MSFKKRTTKQTKRIWLTKSKENERKKKKEEKENNSLE